MPKVRDLAGATGLAFLQFLTVGKAHADGTTGLYGRVTKIINDAAEEKPVAPQIAKTAIDGATAVPGFGSIADYQQPAKSGNVTDSQVRDTVNEAFSGPKTFGGVLGAIITGPFQRIGTDNTIKQNNETATAFALLSNDPAVRQAAGENLDRVRAEIRNEQSLGDPSLDILTAGTSGKAKLALEVYKSLKDVTRSRSEDTPTANSAHDNAPAVRVPAVDSPDVDPKCGTTSYYGQIGDGKCTDTEPSPVDKQPQTEASNDPNDWKIVSATRDDRPISEFDRSCFSIRATTAKDFAVEHMVSFFPQLKSCRADDIKTPNSTNAEIGYLCGGSKEYLEVFTLRQDDAYVTLADILAGKSSTFKLSKCK